MSPRQPDPRLPCDETLYLRFEPHDGVVDGDRILPPAISLSGGSQSVVRGAFCSAARDALYFRRPGQVGVARIRVDGVPSGPFRAGPPSQDVYSLSAHDDPLCGDEHNWQCAHAEIRLRRTSDDTNSSQAYKEPSRAARKAAEAELADRFRVCEVFPRDHWQEVRGRCSAGLPHASGPEGGTGQSDARSTPCV